MKTKTKKLISILLFVLFFIAGCVLSALFLSKNLSEYTPMAQGITNLLYLPMLLFGGLSAFVVSVLFLVLRLIQIKADIGTKIFVPILIVILGGFVLFNTVNIVKCCVAYNEEIYSTEMVGAEDRRFIEEKIEKFSPYYADIEKSIGYKPYYAFSKYTLGNTSYQISQTICDPFDVTFSFTAEYFETDKSYLSGKFILEKAVHNLADENGEPLNPSSVKKETYGNIEYELIEQPTEKLIIISTDSYFFLFNYKDSKDLLNLSREDFIEMAFEQLGLYKGNA